MAANKTTLNSLAALVSKSAKSADEKFGALAEDIADIKQTMGTKGDIAHLDAKFDRLDVKLTKFEENEIDKRKQLEVRVGAIEKHLGLDKKKIAA